MADSAAESIVKREEPEDDTLNEESSETVSDPRSAHNLTAREQLMRQWPSWNWETRND